MLLIVTVLVVLNLLYKQKFLLMDQLKQPLQFMMIFLHISLVFIIIQVEINLVVMQLRCLVGVLKMVLNIGYVLIHGMKDGETMVSLKYSVEAITVVSKLK